MRIFLQNEREIQILKELHSANETISYLPFTRAAAKALMGFQDNNIQSALREQGYDLGQKVPNFSYPKSSN